MMVRNDSAALFSAARFLAGAPSAAHTRRCLGRLEEWRAEVRRFYPWPALEASIAADIAQLNAHLKELDDGR